MSRSILVVMAHPRLWMTALRQARRVVPPGWWRRRPFMPLPTREYMEFRLLTQYGDIAHRPEPRDVLNYLQWCHDWDRPEV